MRNDQHGAAETGVRDSPLWAQGMDMYEQGAEKVDVENEEVACRARQVDQ